MGDTTLAQGRAVAEQSLVALAARVSQPSRDAKYDSARFRIARSAFIPSRVWNDSSVWNASTSVRRTLYVSGRLAAGRYRFESPNALSPITQLADSRHTIRLTRLSSDEYSWDTDIQYAIGSLPAANSGALLVSILSAAEGQTEASIRAALRATLPRGSAAFGQLFRLDSVRTTHLADGSTLATLGFTMTPEGVRSRFPRYADYMTRYARGTRMHWTVLDHNGVAYVILAADNGHISWQVRSRAGTLLALIGPARAMPDTLVLAGAMTIKVGRLTVGVSDYRADLTITRSAHERALSIVTRTEPEWVLPLTTASLLRTPLARPFRGNGSLYRIGIRDDSVGTQTLLTRRLHLEVQESAILRFIGRIGSTAVSEYDAEVERQGDRWMHAALLALASDVASAPTTTKSPD